MRISDWSSDVCSPDLGEERKRDRAAEDRRADERKGNRHGDRPARDRHAARRDRPHPRRRHGAAGRPVGMDHRQYPRSEEHTSELQSLMRISYAVFCLKKKNNISPAKDTDMEYVPHSTMSHQSNHPTK